MFFSHTAGSLGIGHVTEGRAVAFVASAITDGGGRLGMATSGV